MSKYLDSQTVDAYLNLGKTIEVFLGRISDDNEIISYLDLQKTKSGDLQVTYYEHYDEGSLDILDLYSFSFVDPDMNFENYTFQNIDLVTEYIRNRYKLNEVKFVNVGVIQNEYEELLKSERQK